jgi:lipoprotein signal peptidase
MSVEVVDRPARTQLRPPACGVSITVLVVVIVDQLSKAWGWRHADRAHVNSGGNMLVSQSVSAWLRNPVLGAAFDVVDTVALAAALLLFVRRPRAPLAGASLSLLLAGCVSNLCDRLGLHYLTAPGSRRGVIDFLHFWGRLWNVADLVIIAGALLLVPAVVQAVLGRLDQPVEYEPAAHLLAHRLGRRVAFVGLVLTAALAGVGAVASSGADGPVRHLEWSVRR